MSQSLKKRWILGKTQGRRHMYHDQGSLTIQDFNISFREKKKQDLSYLVTYNLQVIEFIRFFLSAQAS